LWPAPARHARGLVKLVCALGLCLSIPGRDGSRSLSAGAGRSLVLLLLVHLAQDRMGRLLPFHHFRDVKVYQNKIESTLFTKHVTGVYAVQYLF
jgi:hypothetical protein